MSTRRDRLYDAHVLPLTRFVDVVRAEVGPEKVVPYFDPLDAGVEARVLFLMEAPGPQAVRTGFISRDNINPTARNITEFTQEAGLPRELTATWNVVPWYIGSGKKIRPATSADIRAGLPYLERLLPLFTRLELVALVGRKAQTVEPTLRRDWPGLGLYSMPHPSPQFVNFAAGNRQRVVAAYREIVGMLNIKDGG